MSFLKDKEWDGMDWLNKAIEPYTFSLNIELAKIPTEYVLSYSDMIGYLRTDKEIRLNTVVNALAIRSGVSKHSISMLEKLGTDKIFELRLEPETELDIENGVVKGSVTLIKKMESLNDDVIRELLPTIVGNMGINSIKCNAARLNEAMDILECKEGRSSSSTRKKSAALQAHIYNVYRDNLWNIRNVDLAIKMLGWIKGYVEGGDRCSLANMSKLKCMTHNGHPIYSMEEIV